MVGKGREKCRGFVLVFDRCAHATGESVACCPYPSRVAESRVPVVVAFAASSLCLARSRVREAVCIGGVQRTTRKV